MCCACTYLQRPEKHVGSCLLSSILLFETESLIEHRAKNLSCFGWLTNSWGPPISLPPVLGVMGTWSHGHFLLGCGGIELRISNFHGKCSYPLIYVPAISHCSQNFHVHHASLFLLAQTRVTLNERTSIKKNCLHQIDLWVNL